MAADGIMNDILAQDQRVFRNLRNVHAECGFFEDDPNMIPLNSKLMSVDLSFDKPSSEVPLPRIHPLDKTTSRRKGKLIARPGRKDKARGAAPKPQSEPCSTDNHKTYFRFLDLPGEIRNQIYRDVFFDATLYLQPLANKNNLCTLAFNVHLGIRAACRQTYIESKSKLYENLTLILAPTTGVTSLPSKIPQVVLNELQSLVIMSHDNEWISDGYLENTQFPSLKSLTYRTNNTFTQQQIFLPDFAQHKEKYLADLIARKLSTVKERVTTRDEPSVYMDWFARIIQRSACGFSVIFEQETAIGSNVTEHAQDAQYLSQILLVSASTSDSGPACKSWLTATEYERRHRCYLKMEEMRLDEPVNGRLPNKYQATKKRLKYIQYQEKMEKFEAVTQALKIKAQARVIHSKTPRPRQNSGIAIIAAGDENLVTPEIPADEDTAPIQDSKD